MSTSVLVCQWCGDDKLSSSYGSHFVHAQERRSSVAYDGTTEFTIVERAIVTCSWACLEALLNGSHLPASGSAEEVPF